MRILITGCRGFIGGSVGRWAAAAGHTVFGIGLASQPDVGWPGSYVQADVAHDELVAVIDAFAPEVLLHAVGTASVQGSFNAPLADLRAAVLSWANVLEATRRSRSRPLLLFPSSAAVYGDPPALPVSEAAPIAPISPYGFHKAACELLAREYSQCFGLAIVVGRLFSVYGARQRRLLLWELFAQAVSTNPEVVLQGSGEETRDYLHVDDVAATFLALASAHLAGLTLLNIGSGAEVRTSELAQLILRSLDVEKPIRTLQRPQTGQPLRWRADSTRMAALAGSGHRSLAEGIRQCTEEWQCT